jgi:NAD(P)-dependent dehydrogenase (short-subunit alcohol dehydrogenase family)
MIEQCSGVFVAISSYAAVRPELSRTTSSVFRAALGAWIKLLAEELAPHGIRANAVLPGFVDSQPVASEIVRAGCRSRARRRPAGARSPRRSRRSRAVRDSHRAS